MDPSTYRSTIEQRLETLNGQLGDPAIGADSGRLASLGKEHAKLSGQLRQLDDLAEVERLLAEAEESRLDPELAALAEPEIATLTKRKAELETAIEEALHPADPLDERDIIVEIRAGTGGDEAALFSANLFRMYQRYAEGQNWQTHLLSESRNDLGGFKEVIFEISGDKVYRHLKFESGVHRVQRIPETEKSGRIHTSTATVAILPKAEEVDVQLRPDDLEIEAGTAGGHGGQSVNTTYSAIRIKHKPTGLVVQCQDERSQKQNKEKALEVLRSRLLQMKLDEQHRSTDSARRSQIGHGERSEKVRTYNFPQDRLTDQRLDQNFHQLPNIMDGDLGEVISALQSWERAQRASA